MKRALIVQGECPCHPSGAIADILAGQLEESGFEVEMAHTMDCFLDRARMEVTDLIVMNWHMASITHEQLAPFLETVRSGAGLAPGASEIRPTSDSRPTRSRGSGA